MELLENYSYFTIETMLTVNKICAAIYSLLFAAFAGCTNSADPGVTDKKFLELARLKNQKQVAPITTSPKGRWHYNAFMFSADIFIKADGKFEYKSQNCFGKGSAVGYWKSNGNVLDLTGEIKTKGNPANFEMESIRDTVSGSDTTDFGVYIRDFSFKLKAKQHSYPDFSAIDFDDLRFRLVGDTLVELDEFGRNTERKYVQRKEKD